MCHKIANASSAELESKLQRQKTPSAIPAFLSNGVYATACLLTITSCAWMKPANKRVAETRDDISKRFQKELYRQENKTNQGALKITWQQGLNKMYIHNPDLIQADYRIADAKQRQKQIWRDMVPGLTLGVNDSFTLGELGDAFGNPTYRINSYLSLGNLLDLPTQVYARRLTYMGSELQAENVMRQQVIALYRIFQEQRLLKLEKRAIDLEGELVRGVTGAESSEIISMKLKHREALEKWEENHDNWNTKVGDFFMTGYDTIDLKANGLPDISYIPSDLNFTNTSRWGLLQLNLLALEEIAEKGRVLDTYFRYLPQANLSVSAPPLYSNSSGQSFDAKQIRLNPSVYWSLDSRGHIGRQLDRLKRETPLKQWRKDKRQREEIKKLLDGRDALQEVQEELANLRKAMNGYRVAVKSGLVKDPEQAIRTMRSLREREVRLAAREIEICSSFWLIDESRWRPITKRWLATRKDRARVREQFTKQKKKSVLKNL